MTVDPSECAFGGGIFPQHAAMLAASGVTPEHAHARGYQSVDTKRRLEGVGITPAGRRVPGLLIPLLRADGSTWGWQYRPDDPRTGARTIKYETPTGQRNDLDVPPGVGPVLDDPTVPLWVTEGTKKADAAALVGLACVALPGVWSWKGTNGKGGKVAVPGWHDVALNGRRVVLAFDSDVIVKRQVRAALSSLAAYLASKGAHVEYLHLPHTGDGKTGLDDYLADGHGVDDVWRLVRPDLPEPVDVGRTSTPELVSNLDTSARGEFPHVEPVALDVARDVFCTWMGDEYDLDALHFTLALVAVEQLDGDAPWGLVLSGPGNAKTETVTAAEGAGAQVTSTISSEGALLSATPRNERAKDATGGLLRKMGPRGVLVIKDMTSILSMNGDLRLTVLGALREVADGQWERNVGTDGGRTLTWRGRVVVIGAVTSAWDTYHEVISKMGERFLLLRVDSSRTLGRLTSGRQSISNIGQEEVMRAELRRAFGGVIAGMDPDGVTITDDEVETLLGLANIVTLARTAVERDRRGEVVDAHSPEAPTRLVKFLGQLLRGGVAVGMGREDALRLAVRVAHDCTPPLRLAALGAVLAAPGSITSDLARSIQKPRSSVDRVLQELHLLGLLEVESSTADTKWRYSIAGDVDGESLALLLDGGRGFTRKVTTRTQRHKEEGPVAPPQTTHHTPSTDFSGENLPLGDTCRHGVPGGDRPDPFVGGRLSCTQCALDLTLAAS